MAVLENKDVEGRGMNEKSTGLYRTDEKRSPVWLSRRRLNRMDKLHLQLQVWLRRMNWTRMGDLHLLIQVLVDLVLFSQEEKEGSDNTC